jgi:hypothetical protein
MRPRGPSDLGRVVNSGAGHTNGSAIRTHYDVQIETARYDHLHDLDQIQITNFCLRDSPTRQILSGTLFPLPWILAAYAYQRRTASGQDGNDSTFGEGNVVVGSIADSCLYAFTLTSLSFLAVMASHHIQQTKRYQKGKAPARARARQKGELSLGSILEVTSRIAGLALPFIAATQLGGIIVALILVLSQSLSLSGRDPDQRLRDLVIKNKTNQFKIGAMAIVALAGIATASTGAKGVLTGVVSLVASILIFPIPLLSTIKAQKSRYELQVGSQSSPFTALVAAGRDRIYAPWAGYVSAILALFFYFISPSHAPFAVSTILILSLSFISATAVLTLAIPLHFSIHSQLALLTSGAAIGLLSFFERATLSTKIIQLSFLALAYAAIWLDRKQSGLVSRGVEHDHQHGKHTRFTGYVLTFTTPGSVVHTILSERESRRIAYFGMQVQLDFLPGLYTDMLQTQSFIHARTIFLRVCHRFNRTFDRQHPYGLRLFRPSCGTCSCSYEQMATLSHVSIWLCQNRHSCGFCKRHPFDVSAPVQLDSTLTNFPQPHQR